MSANKRWRWLFSSVLPLFVLAHGAHHLLTALPIPLLPAIRSDFALDYTQSGWVICAFSLPYGFSQLPSGWLADRIGCRIVVAASICGVALSGLLIGVSQTYSMMMVFLVVMGISGGGYHPAAAPMIASSVQQENRGQAFGLHMAGGSIPYFLAPLIAAAVSIIWGWRGSFITLAIPALVFGIILYVLLGRWPGSRNSARKSTMVESELPAAPGRARHLVVVIGLSTVVQALLIAVISFIPLFLVDNFGTAEETAAALISIIYSTGLWASLLGGYFCDRLGRIPVILVLCFLTGPIIFLLNLAPFGFGIGAMLLLLGMMMYIRIPATEAYIMDQTSEDNRSKVVGIYYFGAMEGSGVLTPVLGYFIDQYGFYTSFAIVGSVILFATLISLSWLRGHRG